MIRVVVADDEVNVCRLIVALVDWHSFNMEVIGVAHNGIKALELIEIAQPDLLITDIRMPGCDGLELIQKAKLIRDDLDFVIISGYRHFEYAQSAIKFGVEDYICKPVKKSELSNTLKKIQQKRRNLAGMFFEQEKDSDRLRSMFFFDVLNHRRQNFELEQINADYHFSFRQGIFEIYILKIDYETENFEQGGLAILEQKAVNLLLDALKQECYESEICFDGSRAYTIANFSRANKVNVRKRLKSAFDELVFQKELFDNISFTLGIGSGVEDISDIERAFSCAKYALMQRLISGKQICECDECNNALVEKHIPVNSGLVELGKSMSYSIDLFEIKLLDAALTTFKAQLLSNKTLCGNQLFDIICARYQEFIVLINNLQNFVPQKNVMNYNEFCEKADLKNNFDSLFEFMRDSMINALETLISERSASEKRPIREAKMYIAENYMKQIGLEQVAEHVGFNSSYFSTLFKKECGQNFLEYITNIRMDQAKELLKETNMPISAICERVGYSDLKHFGQCFKKHTGLKPNEFRKLYS